ncbi:hypothetical protein PAXINDRAFT_19543 [Paxillus involutus ATCC 200175]|jgi:hypothetical protein|uniref:Unplaced genomic scaffold PAXINscaffold_637, whole genome shotgun sequence n=1 Tax=Paxillus involutus ATCC 200175 TaxID=664439 RepID=A0A0C9T7W1_PAXIN|nr:hypothetical protein PAXINDRAFT_19543 [Paxillus involutus ATCC 200175]
MPKSLRKLSHSSVTHRRDDATTKESSPPSTVAARLQRILQKARDVSNIPRGEPSESATEQDAVSGPSVSDAHDSHPSPPDASRSLRRTASTASIDTVRPSSVRTVRRRIDQMCPNANSKQNTKHKSSAKQNVTEKSSLKLASGTHNQDATSPSRAKTTKHKRQSAISARPLRDGRDQSEEDDISAVTARLLQTAPTAAWALQPSLFADMVSFDDGSLSESHGSLSKEKEPPASSNHERKHELPIRSLKPGSHIVEDFESVAHLPKVATHDIKDLQLLIRPYESDVTVWDVLSESVTFVTTCRPSV